MWPYDNSKREHPTQAERPGLETKQNGTEWDVLKPPLFVLLTWIERELGNHDQRVENQERFQQ